MSWKKICVQKSTQENEWKLLCGWHNTTKNEWCTEIYVESNFGTQILTTVFYMPQTNGNKFTVFGGDLVFTNITNRILELNETSFLFSLKFKLP